MAGLIIELPFATPSLNELMGWKHGARTRGWKYRRHWQEVRDAVTAELLKAGVPYSLDLRPGRICRHDRPPLVFSLPRQRRRVLFERQSAGVLDDDNLVGGFKAVRDALVDLGVLVDDTREWLLAEYRQMKAPRGYKRTLLEIEAAGG